MTKMLFRVSMCVALLHSSITHAMEAPPEIQQEAEQEITQLDCQINKLTDDGEQIRSAMQRNFEGIEQVVARAELVVEEARQQAREVLHELADIPMEGMKDQSKEQIIKRVIKSKEARVLLDKLERANKYGELIDRYEGIMNSLMSMLKLKQARADVMAASAPMDQNLQQLYATEAAILTVLKLRETNFDKWERRGVVFSKGFYGDDCLVKENGFNGRWQSADVGGGDVIEVIGSAFNFLPTAANVEESCGGFPHGTVKFLGRDEIVGKWRMDCSGTVAAGNIRMKRESGQMIGMSCWGTGSGMECSAPLGPMERVKD